MATGEGNETTGCDTRTATLLKRECSVLCENAMVYSKTHTTLRILKPKSEPRWPKLHIAIFRWDYASL